MDLNRSLALLVLLLASSLLVSHNPKVNCEQLSTVFVLETSDSSSDSLASNDSGSSQQSSSTYVNSEPQARSLEDSNTRVITDDETHPTKPSSRPVNRLTDAQIAASRQPTSNTPDKSQPKAHQAQQTPQSNHNSHQSAHNQQLSNHQPASNQHSQQQHKNEQRDTQSNHNHNYNTQDSHNHNQNHNQNTNDSHHSNSHKQVSSSTNNHQTSSSNQESSSQITETRRLDDDNISYSQDQDSSPTSSRPRNGSVNSATRSSNNQYVQPSPSSPSSQQRAKPTTSTAAYEESTRKPENRLLISITEDDDNRGPHKHQLVGSGSHTSLGSVGGNHDEHSNKKKQSITISFQDPTKPLIVRPSENGIVISTVNGDSTSQLGNSGYTFNNNNNNKPSSSSINRPIQPGSSSSYQNNNNNNNNEPPYSREPSDGNSVSIPLPVSLGTNGHNNNNHHHSGSTTYRPSTQINGNSNDYSSNNGNNNQRPLTSTLVDQPPRLPGLSGGISSNEERPQRPISSIGGQDSFDNQRPSVRPPINRPPLEPNSGSNIGSEGALNGELTGSSTEIAKFPLNEKNCGLVHETKIVGGEEADPSDFLWMAAIIRSKPTSGEVRPFCGGSLITRRHILTAAHCLENLAPRDVLVRLGSYDFDDATASSFSADYAIDQFRVPATYSKKTHAADIAIMRLKTPLQTSDNYKTVCMPQPRRSYVGALGTVTGYGSQSQTFRRAAPKLRQVTVPIWENRKCSVVYKRNLTESFLCAGYEEGGKDACQGDSGGPLMTEGPNERMMIVGVVSHGIGCGSPGYPGVYTRTTTFLDWIEKNTRE